MARLIFLTLVLLISILRSYGQQLQDTVVDGKHYNFIDYYSNGRLKILGNYLDTFKVGTWNYFLLNGSKLATGQYKLGHKVGRWNYYQNNDKKTIKIKCKDSWKEKIESDQAGNIVLYDFVTRGCMWTFKNGIPIRTLL